MGRARWSLVFLSATLTALACKKPEPPPPPWSVIAREADGASWCRAGGDAGCTPAAAGASHEAVGARLETSTTGRAVVTLDEETSVELGPDASLAFEEPHAVIVRAGSVAVHRTPKGDRPEPVTLRVGGLTGKLDAQVPTALVIHGREDGARATVSVEHGSLRFSGGDAATSELRAGDTASIVKGEGDANSGAERGHAPER